MAAPKEADILFFPLPVSRPYWFLMSGLPTLESLDRPLYATAGFMLYGHQAQICRILAGAVKLAAADDHQHPCRNDFADPGMLPSKTLLALS
jgi:hypothetical protein